MENGRLMAQVGRPGWGQAKWRARAPLSLTSQMQAEGTGQTVGGVRVLIKLTTTTTEGKKQEREKNERKKIQKQLLLLLLLLLSRFSRVQLCATP